MFSYSRRLGLAAVTLMGLAVLVACGGGESAFVASGDVTTVTESKVLPPHSNAYGKSLTEWMEAYWTWFFGDRSYDGEKNVIFLDLPSGSPDPEDPTVFVGELDVSLAPGDAFFLPMMVWVGEVYGDGSEDDPDWPGLTEDAVFEEATVEITLDGKTILDSDDDDMGDYLVFAEFDETIWYDEPTPWGSVGAIWAKGIGFAHTPLSKGEHTLHLFVYSDDWGLGFDNTWYITVE